MQPIDVALVKGTTADEHGNISLERDPFTLGVLYMAMAARNSGGTVIAEVTRTAAAGSLHPRAGGHPGRRSWTTSWWRPRSTRTSTTRP